MTFLRGKHKGSAAILWGENGRVRMSTATDLGFELLLMSSVKAVRRHKFYPTLSYSVKFNGTHSGRYHNVHFCMRTVWWHYYCQHHFKRCHQPHPKYTATFKGTRETQRAANSQWPHRRTYTKMRSTHCELRCLGTELNIMCVIFLHKIR